MNIFVKIVTNYLILWKTISFLSYLGAKIMDEIVTLGLIMPIMNICFLFCEFHFFRLYENEIRQQFFKYGVLAVFFLVFGFVMATFSLNYFQFISFQYTVPITAFFFDGRKRSYFSFILVPLTIALSLSVSGLFSFKAMMVVLIEAVGTILFCELIQVLNKLDVFAKYATSIIIINIITPIENQYKWNLVLTDQLSVFSLPILIGSIIITVLVCSYVKAMQKREAAMEKLEYETNHDNLTALLNYRAFSNYVIQITNQAKVNYTILMIDLDNFKRVNDQFGHLEGNHLLQAFAKKLRLYFEVRYHEKVRVFRFGGEEFCIILKGVTIDDAYATIWEFEEFLKKEDYLTTDGQPVVISFSGGIARANQENNIHEAIRNADAAVYLAKSNGRAQIICPDCSID